MDIKRDDSKNKTEQNWIHMGCLNDLKWTINRELIINKANMYLDNLPPKRFRLSASSEVYNQQLKNKNTKPKY